MSADIHPIEWRALHGHFGPLLQGWPACGGPVVRAYLPRRPTPEDVVMAADLIENQMRWKAVLDA